jgi:hypothetical protein
MPPMFSAKHKTYEDSSVFFIYFFCEFLVFKCIFVAVTVNLSDCVRMLAGTIQKVKTYRQSGYDQLKIAANEIAENLQCSTEFPAKTEVRARRKKRQFDYEETDEPLTEENKFKVNFFIYILDITLNSLNERFTLLETHNKNVQFLYDILKLKDINDKTLEYYCTNYQVKENLQISH